MVSAPRSRTAPALLVLLLLVLPCSLPHATACSSESVHRVTKHTDQRSIDTKCRHDDAGRLTRVTDPLSHYTDPTTIRCGC